MNYASLAGFHDHDRPYLLPDYGGNILFHWHEQLHDRALTETRYGAAQTAFAFAFGRSTNPDLKASFGRWKDCLFRASVRTHEVYATYLSVKAFPKDQHEAMVEQYPGAYRNYYQTMADIIDQRFSTSYTQYGIGKAIMEFCLSTEILENLRSWTPETTAVIEDYLAPDIRLNRVVDALSSLGFEKLFESIQHGAEGVLRDLSSGLRLDVQEEKDWFNLPQGVQESMDAMVIERSREWIENHLVPCFGSPNEVAHSAAVEGFLSNLNRYSQMEMAVDKQTPSQFRVVRGGRCSIHNPRVVKQGIPELAGSGGLEIIQHKPPLCYAISPETYTDETEWYLFSASDSMGGTYAYRVDREALFNSVKQRTKLACSGMPVWPFKWMVGLTVEEVRHDENTMRQILELYTFDRVRFDPQSEVFWYFAGDLIPWIMWFAEFSDVEFLFTVKDTLHKASREGNSAAFWTEDSMPQWLMFKVPQVPGCFVRLLSGRVLGDIFPAIQEHLDSGRIRLSSLDSFGTIPGELVAGLPRLWTCWERL
ncbi:MAG: hypothetical protein ABIS50_09410 [Luteolibacter sp.]|uniref:hypothetical protein n=1 Tax=Luteolibacter sp. TaxID=1962973 RepID=UPI003266B9E6